MVLFGLVSGGSLGRDGLLRRGSCWGFWGVLWMGIRMGTARRVLGRGVGRVRWAWRLVWWAALAPRLRGHANKAASRRA